MSVPPFNLGILAHVDAGKTSLTERLLYDNGAIPVLGSVDGGNTQTDSTEVERRRGITVRSAVAAFMLDDLQINLVDTPGHPDFIAEVERALSVLDGAVLVISAVEGVQAQTRVLLRSLRRLSLPVLIFVNKIDRRGARDAELLAEIRRRLTPAALPMSRVAAIGTRDARAVARSLTTDTGFAAEAAELLADVDDELLARIVDGAMPAPEDLAHLLETQTARGRVHPVFFGSAVTGAGVAAMVDGVRTLLHRPDPAPDGRPRGTVFAIERTGRREKVAYLRLFSGALRDRQRVTLRRTDAAGVSRSTAGGSRGSRS